jgi:hypothetical protein
VCRTCRVLSSEITVAEALLCGRYFVSMTKVRFSVPLDEMVAVLEKHDGALIPAAEELGVKLHWLKSRIDEFAELQAVVRNRDIAIADRARGVIFDLLSADADKISTLAKAPHARWALEHLASDVYSTKQDITLNNKKELKDMSEDELEAALRAKQEQLSKLLDESSSS